MANSNWLSYKLLNKLHHTSSFDPGHPPKEGIPLTTYLFVTNPPETVQHLLPALAHHFLQSKYRFL